MNDKDLQAVSTDLADNITLAYEVSEQPLSAVAHTVENKIAEYVEEEYITSALDEVNVLAATFALLK